MADVSQSKLWNTGMLQVQDACVVLVRTEWNDAIVSELERGARNILEQHRVKQVNSILVPGAVEIPFIIREYWNAHCMMASKRPHAFIALGCVIQGDTPHFDYVCRSVTDGVMQLNLSLPVPVIFGVLTVNDEQQAIERIGGLHGHKGEEAAITALKMISLQHSFK